MRLLRIVAFVCRARNRGVASFVAVCASAALFGVFASAFASAATTHNPEPFSPLDGSGSSLTIHDPSAVAIDEATGNVFLTDGSGGEAVLVLGGTGATPAELAPPFSIAGLSFGSNPSGIAYDNVPGSSAEGTLYVFQPGSIKKYTRNPGTEHYEAAGEIPAPGTAGPAGMTVDGAGNVYLADFTSQTVTEWSPIGIQLHKYNFASSPTNRPSGLAVDNAGDLFVQRQGGGGVYKYPYGSGEVNVSNPSEVTANGASGIAYDSANNHVYVALNDRVVEYDATSLAKISEFGEGVLTQTERLAVDSATERIYVADNGAGKDDIDVFGPGVIVPTVTIGPASGVTGTKATLNGRVNPAGVEVTSCVFEYGTTTGYGKSVPCEGSLPTDAEDHTVTGPVSGLEPNAHTYHYRLVATNANGTERSEDATLVTESTVATEPANPVGTTMATLHGTVLPEGLQYTSCKFEYGLTTNANFEGEASCNPAAPSIPSDFGPHAVSASIGNLQANATYRYRLTATNSKGTVSGNILTFGTSGPPEITEVHAMNADQSSVAVEANVNPSGFQSNYYFEWGPTAAYGSRTPASGFEPSVGSGNQPVRVSTQFSGLSPGATYHYRVVATNSVGRSVSPDHKLETLDACGLPDHRCLELVSPPDVGPVAAPGETSNEELPFQAAMRPGALIYSVINGLPGTTKGAAVLYEATRSAAGWSSAQYSPPILDRNQTVGNASKTAYTNGISSELGCGFVTTTQFLPGTDARARAILEAGGSNLYRRNPDGSYTLITELPPQNLRLAEELTEGLLLYEVFGFSEDCGKVVFSSPFRYPGVPAVRVTYPSVSETFLYEWNEGSIRSLAAVPGPGGTEVEVAPSSPSAGGPLILAGGPGTNGVSQDGARVFFTAERQIGSNLEEIGKQGVFVREGGEGGSTRDISQSTTSVPDRGAVFQYASDDGARVFFTANYGLTNAPSNGPANINCASGTPQKPEVPCDLYEYNLAKPTGERLTDLSATTDPGSPDGGEVLKVIGASADGSHVYFLARGQLVPGSGPTATENEAAHTVSVYGEQGGVIDFAGVVSEAEVGERASAQVSPDGRYLMYQTTADVTGYMSGGRGEVYLYDAGAPSGDQKIICVSCRQDGRHSLNPIERPPLGTIDRQNPFHPRMALVERDGEALVFFVSRDRLATGATEGVLSLYEWSHGQVFHIASEPPGLTGPPEEATRTLDSYITFAGASADGTDLYFAAPGKLTWEDPDEGKSVYDARIEGGRPEPAAAPSPCRPNEEGSCAGSGSALGAAVPSPSTQSFSGPGNSKQKKHHKKKHHKKKHHKKKHNANRDRRTGK